MRACRGTLRATRRPSAASCQVLGSEGVGGGKGANITTVHRWPSRTVHDLRDRRSARTIDPERGCGVIVGGDPKGRTDRRSDLCKIFGVVSETGAHELPAAYPY